MYEELFNFGQLPLAEQEGEETVQGAVAVQIGRCRREALADVVEIDLAASVYMCLMPAKRGLKGFLL